MQSEILFERAKAVMPGGVSSPVRAFKGVGGTPVFFARGEGQHLIDVDGKVYVDFVQSWGPLCLGHAHPSVVEAIVRAARDGTSFGAPCEAEVALAELLVGCFSSIDQVRFVNSGTEATMSALRLARGFTKKSKIIKFEGGFHGHADMLLTKAGSGVATLDLPDSPGVPKEAAQNTLSAPFNDLERTRELFEIHPDAIAAVIVEPIAGNMGMILPHPDFLPGLRKLCDAHGALLILDEVMTGFRAALPGAQAIYGVRPDLVCLGKVIGGGLPVGAYGGRADIMAQIAPLGPVYQSGTLSGNPLAMNAGLATLRAWMAQDVFSNTALRTKRLCDSMKAVADAAKVPMQWAHQGSMFGFFFLKEPHQSPITDFASAKMQVDTTRYARFFHAMKSAGFYFAPSAFEAGFMSAAHQDQAIDACALAFADALEEIVL